MECFSIPPLVNDSDHSSSKKIWSIYYNNREQKIAIYPGIEPEEFSATIRSLYNIPQYQDLEFLDQYGVSISVSCSIPNLTRLYLREKQSGIEKHCPQAYHEEMLRSSIFAI